MVTSVHLSRRRPLCYSFYLETSIHIFKFKRNWYTLCSLLSNIPYWKWKWSIDRWHNYFSIIFIILVIIVRYKYIISNPTKRYFWIWYIVSWLNENLQAVSSYGGWASIMVLVLCYISIFYFQSIAVIIFISIYWICM